MGTSGGGSRGSLVWSSIWLAVVNLPPQQTRQCSGTDISTRGIHGVAAHLVSVRVRQCTRGVHDVGGQLVSVRTAMYMGKISVWPVISAVCVYGKLWGIQQA